MRDDGYDISDYVSINPAYGTVQQFKTLLHEAHLRGIRVITELVLNHTSDQHPWFLRAKHAEPGSPWRDFYVWSDTPDRYRDARVIFKDFERSNWSWDPEVGAYYWHRFYSHQPDLNYDNPAVQKAVLDVVDFWFKLGVDGLRVDAVPYLFQCEATSCENLPETHWFLNRLRRHIEGKFKNRMLLAEANQWPDDAAAYFGDGDECQMAFHFPLMPRLFMSLRMEDRFPLLDILRQTPQIPENCQWALFLRNHDELTLEMVTDEERDYMYSEYAKDPRMKVNIGIRRRLAPLVDNDRRVAELLHALLFSLPGSPVLYYGDEILMGDNIYLGDRDSVRTPMQWSPDRNAGFSRADFARLYLPPLMDPVYGYQAVNVEANIRDTSSSLHWMKRMLEVRKQHPLFGTGSLEFLSAENPSVLAYVREQTTLAADGTESTDIVLCVNNLSRFAQPVELAMQRWEGKTPIELMGRVPFPRIGELPYFVTLGAYAFYWFQLVDLPGEHP
jgi:maltose alpha-D-glucosyltransferase/alpha-amylase